MVTYYEKNKEKIKTNTKQWQKDNPEKIREQNRRGYQDKWVKKNPEKRKKSLDKYYSSHKEEHNKRTQANYQKNKEKILLRQKILYQERRGKLYEILGGRICIKCGYTGLALNFEHINNDGAEDKRRIGDIKKQVLYYLNHPDEAKQKLQVYCANCNWEKELERR